MCYSLIDRWVDLWVSSTKPTLHFQNAEEFRPFALPMFVEKPVGDVRDDLSNGHTVCLRFIKQESHLAVKTVTN